MWAPKFKRSANTIFRSDSFWLSSLLPEIREWCNRGSDTLVNIGAAVLSHGNVIHDPALLLSVWRNSCTQNVSERCWLSCAGGRHTADDLDNVGKGAKVIPSARYLLLKKKYEKVDVSAHKSMHARVFALDGKPCAWAFVYACICTSSRDLVASPLDLLVLRRLFGAPLQSFLFLSLQAPPSIRVRSSWAEFTPGKMSVQLPC